jgi:hypothetical protein
MAKRKYYESKKLNRGIINDYRGTLLNEAIYIELICVKVRGRQ